MTNKEALQLIQERIDVLITDDIVKRELVTMKKKGKGIKEIHSWLINLAIATLYGKDFSKAFK